MSWQVIDLSQMQRFLFVHVTYTQIYSFMILLARRDPGYKYLYKDTANPIPDNSIEIELVKWPENLKKIEFEKACLMINPGEYRFDSPELFWLHEFVIRGYPQPDFDLATKQAIKWCEGIVRCVHTNEKFDLNDLNKKIEFKFDRRTDYQTMV